MTSQTSKALSVGIPEEEQDDEQSSLLNKKQSSMMESNLE